MLTRGEDGFYIPIGRFPTWVGFEQDFMGHG